MSAAEIKTNLKHSRWFTAVKPSQPGDAALYCLAHTGGNAEDYLRWQSDLPANLVMKAVILPGTCRRYEEKYLTGINLLAENIAAAIEQESDGAFYLFGHSMGALLAWEVANKVSTPPAGLLLSASLCPAEIPSPRITQMAAMDNEKFIQEMDYFSGLDASLITNPFLNDMVANRLKRDFKLIAGYRYSPAPPISTPIMVIAGKADAHIPAASLMQWQAYTRHFLGAKRVRGNHFYFNDAPEVITGAIKDMVFASQQQIEADAIYI